jgi:hypothetical protein
MSLPSIVLPPPLPRRPGKSANRTPACARNRRNWQVKSSAACTLGRTGNRRPDHSHTEDMSGRIAPWRAFLPMPPPPHVPRPADDRTYTWFCVQVPRPARLAKNLCSLESTAASTELVSAIGAVLPSGREIGLATRAGEPAGHRGRQRLPREEAAPARQPERSRYRPRHRGQRTRNHHRPGGQNAESHSTCPAIWRWRLLCLAYPPSATYVSI